MVVFSLSLSLSLSRGDGLRWWSVGFGFVEYTGINLLLENKIWFFWSIFWWKTEFLFSNIKNVFMIFGSLNSIFFPVRRCEVRCVQSASRAFEWEFYGFFFSLITHLLFPVSSPTYVLHCFLPQRLYIKMLLAAQRSVQINFSKRGKSFHSLKMYLITELVSWYIAVTSWGFTFNHILVARKGGLKFVRKPIGANTDHLWFKENYPAKKEVRTHITP